jgi:SAM-dependent methyltransferase
MTDRRSYALVELVRDAVVLARISGVRGALRLARHSADVRRGSRTFGWMQCLAGLEACGLGERLASADGLDVTNAAGMEPDVLRPVCEYLYETGVLDRIRSGVYRASNARRFHGLREAAVACRAYQEPLTWLPALLRGEAQYGRDVARDDWADAAASQALTSLFSYAFATRLLDGHEVRTLLDVGCGTGAYPHHLAASGMVGPVFGMDLSPEALAEGRAAGFESPPVVLVEGDVFDLERRAAEARIPQVDVVSFMFVLHEFDDGAALRILASVSAAFPRARILLTELLDRSSDEVRRRGRVFPELKLVHALSRQVLRSREVWERLFASAGYRPIAVAVHETTCQVALLFERS